MPRRRLDGQPERREGVLRAGLDAAAVGDDLCPAALPLVTEPVLSLGALAGSRSDRAEHTSAPHRRLEEDIGDDPCVKPRPGYCRLQLADHALCRDTDPELFFPVGTTGQALVQIERAKQVAASAKPGRVPRVRPETNQDSGIWGGLSEEERRAIRRQRAARARNRNAV